MKPPSGYPIKVLCTNCGLDEEVQIKFGELVSDTICYVCGNKTLYRPKKERLVNQLFGG